MNSYLEVCFPLICLQRLSRPNLATQRCPWQDNWYTSGSALPVLSYWGETLSKFHACSRLGPTICYFLTTSITAMYLWRPNVSVGICMSPYSSDCIFPDQSGSSVQSLRISRSKDGRFRNSSIPPSSIHRIGKVDNDSKSFFGEMYPSTHKVDNLSKSLKVFPLRRL